MKLINYSRMISALAICCFATISSAKEDNAGFHGFYVGGSLGGTNTGVNQRKVVEFDYNATNTPFFRSDFPINESGPIALKMDNSFKGALYAGYGQNWDNWYLGAELFVDVASYKNRNATAENEEFIFNFPPPTVALTDEIQADSQTKLSNFQFGIDLRPGVLLTPTSMLYARIGVAFGDLDLNTNVVFDGDDITVPQTFALSLPLSASKDVAAIRLGAGLEQHICARLNLRMDYIYTYYGKASVAGSIFETLPSTDTVGLGSDTSVKIYNNTVMFGLTYLFNR